MLQDGQDQYNLSSNIWLFEDAHGQYDIQAVSAPEAQARFHRIDEPRLRLIDSDAHYWLRLTVTNQSDRQHWYLTSLYPWLNWFDLYQKDAAGQWHKQPGGQWLERHLWPVNHRLPVHPLLIKPGQSETYYLYIYGSTLELWLQIETPAALARREQNQWLGNFLYAGLALGLAFYNLFLALSLRSKTYFYYSVFVLFFAWGNVQYSGLLYPLLGHWPRFHMYADLLAWSLASWWAIHFSLNFLSASKTYPKLDLGMKVWAGLILLLPLGNYWQSLAFYYQAFNYAFLSGVVVLYFLGIQAYRKGYREARFYLIGWGMLYLAAGLSIGKSMNWLPQWEVFDWSRQVGSALEILFLAMALADRFNLLQKQNLKLQQEVAEGLQAEVAARTEELQDQNRQLLWAQQRAEKAILTKDKFFSIISHDLRGPMGSLAIILNEVVETPQDIDQELLEGMQQTSGNLYQLLNQLLDWSHSQQGSLHLEPQPFSLLDAASEVKQTLQSQLKLKKQHLTLDLPRELCVFADRPTITTVLRNLLSNAVKFTPLGGQIQLKAWPQKETLRVEIIDNGEGMSPETCERLFKIDERIESSPGTSQERGTGLGLILCAEFIHANEGQIGVDSTLGEGSRFWFTLPLGETPAEAAFKKIEATQWKGLKILVVEDNPLHQQTSAKALSQLGLSFQLASDGSDALDWLGREDFDLVLMDIDLPVLNGFESTAKIRQLYGEPLAVVSLSSYSKQEIQEAQADEIFADYLNKPLDAGQLVPLLERLVRNRKIRAEG
ncbi:MAG: 7TM diverse intracellular signaling domain-containing protein [bacterium]|nr:7TM diverse intracellular signaling domain-containing protein [bacterium]